MRHEKNIKFIISEDFEKQRRAEARHTEMIVA